MSLGFYTKFVNCTKMPKAALLNLYKDLQQQGKLVELDQSSASTVTSFRLGEAGTSIYFYGSAKGASIHVASWAQLDHKEGYETTIDARVNSFIEATKLAYDYTAPEFAVAYDEETMNVHFSLKVFIGWLTIFGPKLVKKLGSEKLLKAPAYKVEKMGDGGILIVAAPNPTIVTDKNKTLLWDCDLQVRKITAYLGIKEVKKA